jgi:hypothetical protein
VKERYSLSGAQMLALEAKLNDAQSAAGRIGRKDWLLLFFGVMLTIVVTGLLPPEAMQDILGMALRSLGHIILAGAGQPPPELPPVV